MHHFMAEMLNLKKFWVRRHSLLPRHLPKEEGGHPLPISHLLRRLSSPSPDAEPSHFSFLSDAYDLNNEAALPCEN